MQNTGAVFIAEGNKLFLYYLSVLEIRSSKIDHSYKTQRPCYWSHIYWFLGSISNSKLLIYSWYTMQRLFTPGCNFIFASVCKWNSRLLRVDVLFSNLHFQSDMLQKNPSSIMWNVHSNNNRKELSFPAGSLGESHESRPQRVSWGLAGGTVILEGEHLFTCASFQTAMGRCFFFT